MMEIEKEYWSKEAPAAIVLLVLAAAMVLGALFAGGFTMASAVVYGVDPSEAIQKLTEEPTLAIRSFFRLSQGLSHLLMFIVAPIITIWALWKSYTIPRPLYSNTRAKSLGQYFNLTGNTQPLEIILGVLLLIATVPLVHYTYELNKMLPLPEALKSIEDSTADAIKGLLKMDSLPELIGNLLVIAVLPGLGEELVFRGIVQPQLERVTKQPWPAILITALIFSAVHMQFEGFIPRMLLGVVLGWLYWQTKNLWVPIVAHIFNNGIQVLGVYLYKNGLSSFDLEQDIKVPWFTALISVGLMLGIGYLIKRNRERQTT